MAFVIFRKQNVHTQVRSVSVPILEAFAIKTSIPEAADYLSSQHPHSDVPDDTYFIVDFCEEFSISSSPELKSLRKLLSLKEAS